jgi:hypothetical protein
MEFFYGDRIQCRSCLAIVLTLLVGETRTMR